MVAHGPAYGNNATIPLLLLWLVGTCMPAAVHVHAVPWHMHCLLHTQHPHSPRGVCTHVGMQCMWMAHLPSVSTLGKLRQRILWGGTRPPDALAPSLLALVQWAGGEQGAKTRGATGPLLNLISLGMKRRIYRGSRLHLAAGGWAGLACCQGLFPPKKKPSQLGFGRNTDCLQLCQDPSLSSTPM